VNVFDSTGWLEHFADGPNAEFFTPAVLDTDALIVSTISLLEAFKRVYQQRDETTALSAVALMRQGAVVDLDSDIALMAAKLSAD
jgi:predicted nucleic acid-binding protein